MIKKIDRLAMTLALILALVVQPTLAVSAAEPAAEVKDYHFDWPVGCYYHPYSSVAELPSTIRRYNNATPDEMFNSATYYYVAETDINHQPGSVIASGSTDDGAIWDISVPQVFNAPVLNAYCEQYGIALIMAHHTTDRNRVILIGLDKDKLDTSKVMMGAQATFGSDSVFQIQMSGQVIDTTAIPRFRNTNGLVNRAILQKVSSETTSAVVWTVDNLGDKVPEEDGYVSEHKIASEMTGTPYFTETTITLTPEVEDCAIQCIDNYNG